MHKLYAVRRECSICRGRSSTCAHIRRVLAAYRVRTRYLQTLFPSNVGVEAVTGIVQEFQFGMNWSSYSRYVGGIFGAPLTMEGLVAHELDAVQPSPTVRTRPIAAPVP
jgi:hypothetical protein